jgi:hypothetical protein
VSRDGGDNNGLLGWKRPVVCRLGVMVENKTMIQENQQGHMIISDFELTLREIILLPLRVHHHFHNDDDVQPPLQQ